MLGQRHQPRDHHSWRHQHHLTMDIKDALLACLPPVAYDTAARHVRGSSEATAVPLEEAVASAEALLSEHQPDLTTQALSDWERNYGLPDACIGGAWAPADARRMNLLARIRGRGDLSRGYFLVLANLMGYAGCSITELGGMTCVDPCDSAVNGENFIGVWRLNVPVSTAILEATCESPCDVQLRRWGNQQLECVILRHKPAHTIALFGYTP